MGLFSFFRPKKNTAQTAKERLKITVEHQRSACEQENNAQPAFMEDMKREILEVVQKYFSIEQDDINTDISNDGEMEVLALNINLADKDTKAEISSETQDKPADNEQPQEDGQPAQS